MAGTRPLRRLLRVLEIEEEQRQLDLEAAMHNLRRLERALDTAQKRGRDGRLLIAASAHSGQMVDRLAGMEEILAAARSASVLAPRLASGEREAARLREQFLAKRVERRQTEQVIGGIETREAAKAARRGQQTLDEGHLRRMGRQAATKREERPSIDGGRGKSRDG